MGSNMATNGDTRDPMRAKADTVLSAVARWVVGNRSGNRLKIVGYHHGCLLDICVIPYKDEVEGVFWTYNILF